MLYLLIKLIILLLQQLNAFMRNQPDITSLNTYLSSYHTLTKTTKLSLKDKLQLPPLTGHLFIKANLHTNFIKQHIRQTPPHLPIFTFSVWAKLKQELRNFLRKIMQQKMKEINQGTLLTLKQGESINMRADCFCLAPHNVYTVIVPLEKCEINSGCIAVSGGEKWEAENEEDLFGKLMEQEMKWEYCGLEEGDIIVIGRDCLYGSFRNESTEDRHFVQTRWVRHDHSSSSSNSS